MDSLAESLHIALTYHIEAIGHYEKARASMNKAEALYELLLPPYYPDRLNELGSFHKFSLGDQEFHINWPMVPGFIPDIYQSDSDGTMHRWRF